uniref:C-type lectin domain-containing protein n=1 Tax=Globodera pallida TaxID=36090 RepID=A0A183BX82_GLOPA
MGLLLVYLSIIALSGSSVSNELLHFEQNENTNVQLHDSVPSDLVPWITGPRNKKYQFNIGKQSWLAAREKCLAQNADLVTIESTEELQWLLTHYKPQLPHLHERQVQIGLLLDSPISNSKQSAAAWRWVSGKLLDDQSSMQWVQGEPFENSNGTEHCALLNINADAKIDDVDCDLDAGTESNYRFVCERTHQKHIEHESLNNPLWKKLEDILTFFGISGPESDKSLPNRTNGLEEEGYWDKVLATSDAFKRPRNSSTELEINLIAGKKPSGIIVENKMASNAAELADRMPESKNEKIGHDEQRQNANETQNAKKEDFDSKTDLSAKNIDEDNKKLEAKPPVVVEKIAVGKIVAASSSIQTRLIEPKREEHSVDKADSLLLDKAQNTVTSAASTDNDGTSVEGVQKPATEELDGQNSPKLRAFRTRLLNEDQEQEKKKKKEEKVKPADGKKESIRDGDENAKAKTPEQTNAKTEEQIKQLNKAQKEVINAEEINDQEKQTEEINDQKKPKEEIKEKPNEEINDPKEEIKEKPKEEINDQKKPKEEIKEKPKNEIKEKPKEEIKSESRKEEDPETAKAHRDRPNEFQG